MPPPAHTFAHRRPASCALCSMMGGAYVPSPPAGPPVVNQGMLLLESVMSRPCPKPSATSRTTPAAKGSPQGQITLKEVLLHLQLNLWEVPAAISRPVPMRLLALVGALAAGWPSLP